MSKGRNAEAQKSEVLQGTLDLMGLKVLDALGQQHGYGIARRIEQVSKQVLQLLSSAPPDFFFTSTGHWEYPRAIVTTKTHVEHT